MKKMLFLLCVLLFLTGCGRDREVAHVSETTIPPATQAIIESFAQETLPEPVLSFAELERTIFHFSSGAGGWRTELTIGADGSFQGRFQDFNAETGEGYNGVLFVSDFAGRFSEPVYVNEYTWALRLEALTDNRRQSDEIVDGILYDYGDPYGIEGGEEFLLYLPEAPLEALPQEYREWVGYYDLSMTEDTQLPFCGLYNVNRQCGFSSYDVLEKAQALVDAAASQDSDLLEAIREDPHATQADMNVNAATRYQVWDDILNELWGILKQTLEEEAMHELTNEELAWIAEKEAAVKEAGKDVEGGSLYPLVTGMKAADLTRDRVYVLLEYLAEGRNP